jgi:hypothetical protein
VSTPRTEQLVDEYLARLEAELADVSAERREEIVSEIRSHIAEERARGGLEGEADLYNLLERLGDPAEIAAAAEPAKADAQPARAVGGQVGAIEVLAMVLTPIIWPVGVILYWTSSRWRTRDKLIATLIMPGGYPGLLFTLPILLLSTTVSGGCGTVTDAEGKVISQQCYGWDALPGWEQFAINVAAIAVTVIVLLLPVLVGIYMARQLRKNTVEAA